MSRSENTLITPMQFTFIISGIQVSVSILSLPRHLAEAGGTDGWMAIPIGFAFSLAASFIIVKIMQNMPDGTILDLLSKQFGAWAGKSFALLLCLYFLSFVYDSLDRGILVTKAWLMPNTSSYLFMVLFLVPAYIISKHGPQTIGRYSELIFFFSGWIPFIYLFTLKHAHWLYLLPLFKEGLAPVLKAVPAMLYPSLGMVATFILYPHLKKKEKAFRSLFHSSLITMLIYLYITMICFMYFSPDEINEYNDPTISILKTIEFRFMERIEVPFIAFYLFLFSLAWIPSTYIAAFCLRWIFGLKDTTLPIQLFCIALVISSYFYLPTFNQSDILGAWIGWFGIGMEYVFPCLLLVFIASKKAWMKRNRI